MHNAFFHFLLLSCVQAWPSLMCEEQTHTFWSAHQSRANACFDCTTEYQGYKYYGTRILWTKYWRPKYRKLNVYRGSIVLLFLTPHTYILKICISPRYICGVSYRKSILTYILIFWIQYFVLNICLPWYSGFGIHDAHHKTPIFYRIDYLSAVYRNLSPCHTSKY